MTHVHLDCPRSRCPARNDRARGETGSRLKSGAAPATVSRSTLVDVPLRQGAGRRPALRKPRNLQARRPASTRRADFIHARRASGVAAGGGRRTVPVRAPRSMPRLLRGLASGMKIMNHCRYVTMQQASESGIGVRDAVPACSSVRDICSATRRPVRKIMRTTRNLMATGTRTIPLDLRGGSTSRRCREACCARTHSSTSTGYVACHRTNFRCSSDRRALRPSTSACRGRHRSRGPRHSRLPKLDAKPQGPSQLSTRLVL